MKPGKKFNVKLVEAAIKKWERIIFDGGKDTGTKNCPLCRVYNQDEQAICDECPIKEITGEGGCSGTPYIEWDYHSFIHHDTLTRKGFSIVECKECQKLAENELKFLETVREKLEGRDDEN